MIELEWTPDEAARELARLPRGGDEYNRQRTRMSGRLGIDAETLDLLADNLRSRVPVENEAAPRFIIPGMNWRELAEGDPPPRRWHVPHWLTTGSTLCAGAGGMGKTRLIQQLSTHLSIGRCFLTNAELDRPRRVLMWACEDDRDELWRRQAAICDHHHVPMEKLEDFHLVPRQGADNVLLAKIMGKAAWTNTWNELRQQVNDVEADVLALDNLTQVCAELNDPHMAVLFVNACASLRPDLAVILIGHPSKSAGSEYGGTMQWESACRMRWYFSAKLPDQQDDDGDDNVRYLAKRKSNYSALDFVRFTLTDSGVLVPEIASGGPRFDAKAKAEQARDAILDAIPKLIDLGACPTNSSNSPGYLPKLMGEYRVSRGFTRKELHSAMVDLLNSGDIQRGAVGQYANRSPRMGLVVSG